MTTLLPKRAVAKKIGVNERSVDRYADDPRYEHLEFPKPTEVNGRRFWDEAHIETWIQAFFINPLFADLQATLIRTLAGFPAARVAVIQAFREIEARGGPSAAPAIEHNPMVDADADRAA